MQPKKALRQHAARLVAIAAILILFLLSQQPVLSRGERQALTTGFGFASTTMPENGEAECGGPGKKVVTPAVAKPETMEPHVWLRRI